MVQTRDAADLTISAFAATAGVGVETVRFYQRRGLLGQPDAALGVRRYGASDVQALRFIRSAQGAGFTLDEIRELLSLDAIADRARVLELAQKRLEHIDARLKDLKTIRTGLSRIAAECAHGGDGPCPIIEAFEA